MEAIAVCHENIRMLKHWQADFEDPTHQTLCNTWEEQNLRVPVSAANHHYFLHEHQHQSRGDDSG